MTTRFHSGELLATPGALAALDANDQCLTEFVARHLQGDWGEALSQDDKDQNEWNLVNDERLHSAYHLRNGQELWIITERDRSVTTALLPSEY